MIHPRYITFTNAEIVERGPLHKQLGELADFLWNDPRPHQEGKFEMRLISMNWIPGLEKAEKALSRCGTAACACGWDVLLHDDIHLYERVGHTIGVRARDWMFGGSWTHYDNSPYGASYRIDHYLKYRNPNLYNMSNTIMMSMHYPENAFWLKT